MFRKKNKPQIHFIGIGGIGMSGIAEILVVLGYKVTGSDVAEGANVEKLRSKGVKISIGHSKENIAKATVVVYSSAIKKDNPEYMQAIEKGLPIIRRAQMLAELMRLKYGIAVAGTHGKTTTSSILATILHESGLNPTHVIGGIVENLGGHAKVGSSNFLVAEADESDGTFLLLTPILSIITNIDNDHLDFYKEKKYLISAFNEFANKIPFYGCASLNIHDQNLRDIELNMNKPSIFFGIYNKEYGDKALYQARNINYKYSNTVFDLYYDGKRKCSIDINLPGEHNVLNALAAISIAHQMELDFEIISKSIKKFKNVGRRFNKLFDKNNCKVIDDYAHHPTAIQKTLETIRLVEKGKVIAIFEPHRFTRTKMCWNEFLHSFNNVDKLFVLPIYKASEEEISGITSERLVKDINNLHPNLATYIGEFSKIKDIIEDKCNNGKESNTFIALGAGSIGKKIREIVKELKV